MRRAGIAFETVPPPLPDTLPRMDVAAFVGFARSGPLDVPVAVEDMTRFRDLFGDDQPLAWDPERGAIQHGHLGASVDAFFGGGGRRCWIVRVAHAPYTHRFPLPGVVPAGDSTLAHPARLQARAPGSWAQDLQVGTTLIARSLAALPDSRAGPAVDPSGMPSYPLSIDVAGAPGTVSRGDLLELRFMPLDFTLFMVVGSVVAIDRGLRITSPPSASSRRWVWTVSAAASPPSDDPPRRYPELVLRDDVTGAGRLTAWRALPESGRTLQVRRLTFEITAWRDGRLRQRLGELAFSPDHPRFFGNLPTDEQLFAAPLPLRRDGRDAELAALRAEASGERDRSASVAGERFAFAGPAYPDVVARWPLLLPSGMDLGRNLAQAKRALGTDPADGIVLPPAREQDGVAELVRTPFFDARLQDYSSENLLTTAQALHNAAREWDIRPTSTPPRRLQGLHAVLPVEEATLLAIPDATHRAWSLAAQGPRGLLGAPVLHQIGTPDATARLEVGWTSVDSATSYELQWDETPDFTAPIEAYQGAQPTARVTLPPSCAQQRYFRVRALRLAQPSPWSNTRVLGTDRGLFLPCGQDELPELILSAGPTSSGDQVRLSWASRSGGPLTPTLSYHVEVAYNAAIDAPVKYDLPAGQVQFEIEPRGALRYCRVRAALDAGPGPWSNTVVLPPGNLAQPALHPRPARGGVYDDSLLLDVHRAALRFCAARGDLFALLALPGHYGRQDVDDHLARLTPDDTAADTSSRDVSMEGRKRLSRGEAGALSYAALYHPWVARARPGRDPEFQPPDGVAAGALAAIALDRGAWISCANRPLAGALALAPALNDADIDALLELQANVLRRAPRGVVLADDRTLGRERELRETGVRRLLILLRRLALREGNAYVFEPMVAEFPDRVRHRFERMLSTLHLRGAFSGHDADEAFRVVTDASVNPPQSLDLGRFVVELRVAPSRPLSFLRVRLVQRGPQELVVSEV